MKKLLAVLLICTLVLGLCGLAACNRAGEDASASDTEAIGSGTTAVTSGGTVTLEETDSDGAAASGETDTNDTANEAGAAGAAVAANDVKAQTGKTVVVPVTFSDLDSVAQYGDGTLAGIDFNVTFDPAVLSFEKVESPLAGNWAVDSGEVEAGNIRIMMYENSLRGSKLSGELQVANLTFTVLSGAPSGDTSVTISVGDLCDSQGNNALAGHIAGGTTVVTVK